MATPKFKQRCAICKKNWVEMYSHRQFPICADCHLKRISDPVEDERFKKLLDIPPELYRQSVFLRNIKESYLRFKDLTDKQIEAFKKTVEEMKKGKKEEQ